MCGLLMKETAMANQLHGNDGLAPSNMVFLELEHVGNDTCNMKWLEWLTIVATALPVTDTLVT